MMEETFKIREREVIYRIAAELKFIPPGDRARIVSEALEGAAYFDKVRGGKVVSHSLFPELKASTPPGSDKS